MSASTFAADLPPLRWGADAESGAPYSFYDPEHPDQLIGFEVDLINAVADELGRKPVFVQNAWDGLILGLNRGDYDLVVNGLEITPERQKEVFFTEPYLYTGETLSTRTGDTQVQGLTDLPGRAVGTIRFSVAHRMLEAMGRVDVRTYESEQSAYDDLLQGRLQAVLLDEPIALYYARPNPKIQSVGGLIGKLQYGIALRKSDKVLGSQVSQALTKLRKSGKIREILENWGLWNEATAQAWGMSLEPGSPARAYEHFVRVRESTLGVSTWERVQRYWAVLPQLLRGAGMSLLLSVVSMAVAVVLGAGISLLRASSVRGLRWSAMAYVEAFRGTPLLVQLIVIFYGLPKIGLELSPFWAAVLGLGLNYAACESENYRAGFEAVPLGQREAAHSLGLTRLQQLWHVLCPQALRVVLPPITNDFIALIKDSSLVSVITMTELTKVYGQMASTYYDYLGFGGVVAVLYFLMGYPWVLLARGLERRLRVGG